MKQLILDHIVGFIVGLIISGFLAFFPWLIRGNRRYFKLLEDFRKKLPPKLKQAKGGVNENLGLYVVELKYLNTGLTETDVDVFLKQLEDFNYQILWFKKVRITKHSQNLQRIINTTNSFKFKVSILQELLEMPSRTQYWPYLFGKRIYKAIGC